MLPTIFQASIVFGARRRETSAWMAKETYFSQDYSTGDSSKSSLFPNPIPEEKGKGHLYSVDNEVVNDLRRHTRAYVKKIGELPFILVLPRREYKKKDRPILEDTVLVEDFEELVETTLQEVV